MIYIDSTKRHYGSGSWCHMISDTSKEEWIQHEGKPSEHFDLVPSKRALAVRLGARELTSREFIEVIRSKRSDGDQGGNLDERQDD